MPTFYKRWGFQSYGGIDGNRAQSRITSLEGILRDEGTLKSASRIEAFAPKKYPSLEELIQKVRDQIFQ